LFAGYLSKKFAGHVLLISSGRDLLYAGEKILQLLSFPKGATQLDDLKDDYWMQLFDAGIRTVEQHLEGCLFRNVPLRADKKSTLVDIKIAPVSIFQQQVNVIEIELLLLPQQVDSSATLADRKMSELKRENAFLDAFVQGASHDLNGSLLVFKSFIDLFRRYTSEEKKENALQFMEDTSIRMGKILRGLSDLVNYQKKRRQPLHRLSFEELFQSVQLQLEHKINEANPVIHTDFSKATHVHYFKAYLNSILYNLLSNAIKYCRKEVRPEVHLSTYPANGFVVLEVRDNGIGMDLEECGHLVFEPFQRFCPEREGTGIGLSFIHKIVEEQGGYIELDSKPNKGSTFRIFLKNKWRKNS
ncbi:MAG: HAMP domain-containing sensor histidine kinase, partial [Bacteroidota bacterium]